MNSENRRARRASSSCDARGVSECFRAECVRASAVQSAGVVAVRECRCLRGRREGSS